VSTGTTKLRDTQRRYSLTKEYFALRGSDILTAGRELHEVEGEFRDLMKTGVTQLAVICLNSSSLSHLQPQEIYGATVENVHSDLTEELKRTLALNTLESETEIGEIIHTALDWAKAQALMRKPEDTLKLLRQDARQPHVC